MSKSEESDVQRSVRKGSEHLCVSYRSGSLTKNLYASEFLVRAVDGHVILSMDLSQNQRLRNKKSNAYADVLDLLEQISDLESIQIDRDTFEDALLVAVQEHGKSGWVLELRFLNDVVRTVPISLAADKSK